MTEQTSIPGIDVAKLQVSSVLPAAVPPKFVLIKCSARETTDKTTGKKKVIAAENRLRCVLIPELVVESVPSKFQIFVLNALYDVAKDQLDALWSENGDQMREVDAAIWSVDALLGFAARKAESKRLTKETIVAWFKTSKLYAAVLKAKGEKFAAGLTSDLEAIAQTIIPWSEEKLLKTIAMIGKFEEDATADIGAAMIRKMDNRVTAIRKERESLGSIDEVDLDSLDA